MRSSSSCSAMVRCSGHGGVLPEPNRSGASTRCRGASSSIRERHWPDELAFECRQTTPGPAPGPAPAPAPGSAIAYDQFAAVDLRIGVVRTCERVPKKDKLLLLTVDIGEPSPRTIVAGLALSFTPEQLVGRRVVVVANLAPRDFGKGLVSHGMILASGPSEKLVLASVDGDAAPGAKLK